MCQMIVCCTSKSRVNLGKPPRYPVQRIHQVCPVQRPPWLCWPAWPACRPLTGFQDSYGHSTPRSYWYQWWWPMLTRRSCPGHHHHHHDRGLVVIVVVVWCCMFFFGPKWARQNERKTDGDTWHFASLVKVADGPWESWSWFSIIFLLGMVTHPER